MPGVDVAAELVVHITFVITLALLTAIRRNVPVVLPEMRADVSAVDFLGPPEAHLLTVVGLAATQFPGLLPGTRVAVAAIRIAALADLVEGQASAQWGRRKRRKDRCSHHRSAGLRLDSRSSSQRTVLGADDTFGSVTQTTSAATIIGLTSYTCVVAHNSMTNRHEGSLSSLGYCHQMYSLSLFRQATGYVWRSWL